MTYVVGIDLGTTHCAASSVDLDLSEKDEVAEHVLAVPQLVAPGQVEARPLLPSFLYVAHPDELPRGELALPWGEGQPIVGTLARELGSKTPARLVSSAKSWLCHPGVDRRGPILPTDAPPDCARVSPLDASMAYLAHLAHAWDARGEGPLSECDVTLTVPASFDPAARELTAEAAQRAGLERLVLLEEPQAALYAWILGTRGAWREQVRTGDVILVVDVGGGTTDFSLIEVAEEAGSLALRRVAVGDHILLGGDNMDLALAAQVKNTLASEGKSLDAWQLGALVHACRGAKEALLAEGATAERAPIVVPSRGSKLVGGSLRTELERSVVARVLVDGFFPEVGSDARPGSRARAALTQLGLPYAQDAGITRHLAHFLGKQRGAVASQTSGTFLHPTAVLFNGGVFRAPGLRARLTDVLDAWLRADGAPPARVLAGADLDLAVARGAAYHGYVRQGGGVRIRGGTARSFYVGVESAMPAVPGLEPPLRALCVAPFGMEEGSSAEAAPGELGLVVGEPVRFRFFGSSVRRDDAVGTTLDRWNEGELDELQELEATLPAEGRTAGEVVPVRLQAEVTEVGTLALHAVPRGGGAKWKVELDVRG